jgi:iron complex outermembrane recepter protein
MAGSTARLRCCAGIVFVLSCAGWAAADAQATDAAKKGSLGKLNENPVALAEDGFGLVTETDSIGLYGTNWARGFDPSAAGNIRVNGLYADLLEPLTARVSDRSVVQVGSTTLGALLPAPSGLVDYHIRQTGTDRQLGMRIGVGPFSQASFDLDGGTARTGSFSVAGGGSIKGLGDDYRGTKPTVWSVGVVPQWQVSDQTEVMAFVDWASLRRRVEPFYYTAGPYAPVHVPRGHFLGEPWSHADIDTGQAGFIIKTQFGHRFALDAGVFDSVDLWPRTTFDQIANLTPAGFGERSVVNFPYQSFRSVSGEARLSYAWTAGQTVQRVALAARGQHGHANYGGDFTAPTGSVDAFAPGNDPSPPLNFNPRTDDHTDRRNFAVGYTAFWQQRLEFDGSVGLIDYQKVVRTPPNPEQSNSTHSILHSALLAYRTGRGWRWYASTSRGLEGSGVGPPSATNAYAVLPAITTHQVEVGFRGTAHEVTYALSAFDIHKPYAAVLPSGLFALSGTVTHRGIEGSIAGELTPSLRLVMGAVAFRYRVDGPLVASGALSSRPVGQPAGAAQATLNYRVPRAPRLTLEASGLLVGPRVAKLDGSYRQPMRSDVDVGARYQTTLGAHPTELRLQVFNVLNSYAFIVGNDAGVVYTPARSARLSWALDW